MKKLSIILACVLVAMMSCTKSKEVHPEIGDGNDEIVTVGMKDVHVEYARIDHAEYNRVVFHYCPADANGNAQQFESANMTKKETFFELTLNDLLSDTLYWYYYELFPNGDDAFTTMEKTFRTQTYVQPEPPTPGDAPEGAIAGLFSVSPTQKVYFSQGNLQYQASTNTWRFAEYQWDYVGGTGWSPEYSDYGTVFENGIRCDNSLVSPYYEGWIDLFGWGTSGFNHGSVCYQPWSVSQNHQDYYVYGSPSCDLFDNSGQADWGYNAITNGGNSSGIWRTPKAEEWSYLFFSRDTNSGIRYVKGTVNNIKGVILFPDNWDTSVYEFQSLNNSSLDYSYNVISESNWLNILEPLGCVFFPAANYRFPEYVYYGGDEFRGYYWSSSYCRYFIESYAYSMHFYESDFNVGVNDHGGNNRIYGFSVRLVQDAY